ncbi:MAG: hypothetical protein EPN88_14275 [Bacteroidetes bacterium]|nr:MAG: hypothetical protein EPN88_14275 [Bacteroidota bacterium]
MKKSNYKPGVLLFISLFIVSFTLSAQEVTKEFHKEFIAGAKTLEISNRYGDVVIQSWDKDQVVIDVKVTVELSNKERAEKLLSYIDVQFSDNENTISAKTVIDDKFNFTGWGNSRKFSIDYNIKMPVGTDLTLANIYGNTDIDELHGLLNLDIKYGNLTAGKLTRGKVKPHSILNLAYGKSTIDEAGWLDLTIRYTGSTEITKSQALLLDSKHSKLILGETSSVVGESKYDNIRIESINNLVLENGYTETNIGLLTKKLHYNGSYGSFSVESIPAGFESIDVETRYMGVRLGIEESASYQLDAKVSYGGLKYNEDNFKNQRRIVENNSNEVSGTVGKEESPSSKVNIVASYGSVKLY